MIMINHRSGDDDKWLCTECCNYIHGSKMEIVKPIMRRGVSLFSPVRYDEPDWVCNACLSDLDNFPYGYMVYYKEPWLEIDPGEPNRFIVKDRVGPQQHEFRCIEVIDMETT